MPKMNTIATDQPWKTRALALHLDPDALLISLLTDEIGCACLAEGQVPEYIRVQALDALAWNCTEERKSPAEQARDARRAADPLPASSATP